MVLVTMQVRAKSWETFRDALDWLVEMGKPQGLNAIPRVYRGLSDSNEILMLCEVDDQDIWYRWAERVGAEFDQRTDTTGHWTDKFWVPAEDASTF